MGGRPLDHQFDFEDRVPCVDSFYPNNPMSFVIMVIIRASWKLRHLEANKLTFVDRLTQLVILPLWNLHLYNKTSQVPAFLMAGMYWV